MMRLFFDVECYENYFLALFMTEDGRTKSFQIYEGDTSEWDSVRILSLISHKDVELITFNGMSYDIPMLTAALVWKDTKLLKRASDRIITRNVRPWQFYKSEGLVEPETNHIDLIEVAPGIVGLKLYGGRMGTKKLQELPLPPDAIIEPDQIPLLRGYCKNDTVVTRDLYNTLVQQIELRRLMSKEYALDLRSKSDAQIAEAVLKSEYKRLTGEFPPKTEPGYSQFYYDPPEYVRFRTPLLKSAFDTICATPMTLDSDTGHVKMPKEIANLRIRIGGLNYKLGIGGLHSRESEKSHHSDDENLLIDRDVASYYPTMMLNMNVEPGGFGKHFKEVYEKILKERLEAKRSGDKTKADSLKITLNGTFGKLANKYSTLYSPENMLRVTLTGQLLLLMLIEAVESYGISVVSANTDGIVIKCPRVKKKALDTIVHKWEVHTGLTTEETVYSALYSRDVNNYIAVKEDGSTKTKGVYAPTTISKNPQSPICSDAVCEYLTKGTPIEKTLRTCKDITKFLTLRTVGGGAVKNNKPLGKAIRWYYAEGEAGAIHYVTNGNTVPRSEGAKVLLDIPDDFPNDVDYGWYMKECSEILIAIGAVERPFVEKLPRKNSKAWKALLEEGRIMENSKGKWEWVE